MDNNRKVTITSMVNGRVGVTLPELRFKRSWPKMGTKVPVDYSILQEAIFDDGFARMLKDGILVIEDKQALQDLGLIDSSAIAEVALNEMQMIKMLKVDSLESFTETFNKMSMTQKKTLADIAIEKRIEDYDKCELIRNSTGINIRRTIELDRQAKEQEKAPVAEPEKKNPAASRKMTAF